MGLGGSRRWGWEVNCEELSLPSVRLPTPVPIRSDTAVAQKDLAAKNSIKTRIFNMRGASVFQILWPAQSFQSSDDKEMRNYVFPTISSSNWFLLLRSLHCAWEWKQNWEECDSGDDLLLKSPEKPLMNIHSFVLTLTYIHTIAQHTQILHEVFSQNHLLLKNQKTTLNTYFKMTQVPRS